jgi:hypothetical protein
MNRCSYVQGIEQADQKEKFVGPEDKMCISVTCEEEELCS